MKWLRKYWWVLLIALAIMTSFSEPVRKLFRFAFSRGGRVVKSWPFNKATGVVEADPNKLAAEAGVSLDAFALASMLSSEHGNDPEFYKQAIAMAALNEAKARGKSISALLLDAVNPAHKGFFGSQKDETKGPPHPSDRYASTAVAPYEDDLGIAVLAVNGFIEDVTYGARQFDSPQAQDKLYKTGKYSLNAEALAAKRRNEGKVEVNPEGIDPYRLRFWRRA